jgi:hypothetical protein
MAPNTLRPLYLRSVDTLKTFGKAFWLSRYMEREASGKHAELGVRIRATWCAPRA